MRILLSFLFCISTYSGFSQSSNSIYVATNEKGDSKFYFYSSAVANDYNGLKVWVKVQDKSFVYRKRNYANVETKTLFLFNCDSKQYKLLKAITYSSQGTVIQTDTREEILLEWEDVIPETVIERVMKKVCDSYTNLTPE